MEWIFLSASLVQLHSHLMGLPLVSEGMALYHQGNTVLAYALNNYTSYKDARSHQDKQSRKYSSSQDQRRPVWIFLHS